MQPKTIPQLLNCLLCNAVPLRTSTGIQCVRCRRSEKGIDAWNEKNRLATILDAPETLVHEQFGLTPRAIEILLYIRESARPAIEAISRSGVDDFTNEEVDLLFVYVISSLSQRPDPERIKIGDKVAVI